MVSVSSTTSSPGTVIRPGMGTGWLTTVDGSRQEVQLQLKLLGLPLAVKRRVPFSNVARLGVVCRESWWSRAGMWQGGRTIRIATLKPSDDAYAVAARLREKVGLPAAEGA